MVRFFFFNLILNNDKDNIAYRYEFRDFSLTHAKWFVLKYKEKITRAIILIFRIAVIVIAFHTQQNIFVTLRKSLMQNNRLHSQPTRIVANLLRMHPSAYLCTFSLTQIKIYKYFPINAITFIKKII